MQELEWTQGRGSHAAAQELQVFHVQILTEVYIQKVDREHSSFVTSPKCY